MRPLVVANWKMNGSNELLAELITALSLIKEFNDIDIVICPPTIFIPKAIKLTDKSNISIGAQNCYMADYGAYTGEISPYMLQQFGVRYVILGHSERRVEFFETDLNIAKKAKQAQNNGLIPIICVGETAQERDEQLTFSILDRQLELILSELDFSATKEIVIAYEPIWAIGTGKTASPELVEQIHAYIHKALLAANVAAQVRIIYGGSLQPGNVSELFKRKYIDGGLVGGASLQVQDFIKICYSVVSGGKHN